MLQIVYAHEPVPTLIRRSLFLEGPTPRSPDVRGYRQDALDLLIAWDWDGTVFVPEPRDGLWRPDYDGQVLWEQKTRAISDVIVCWVPRDLAGGMPALTTNVEVGEDYNSGRFAYGRPKNAEKTRYLDLIYTQATGLAPAETLEELLRRAIDLAGEGAIRHGGDALVPLRIWNHPTFQAWHASQTAVGNRIEDARVLSTFPTKGPPFMFQMSVSMWVATENRSKNEILTARTDTACVVAFGPIATNPLDTEILLVEEYRLPARNAQAMVLEFPGGSSSIGKTGLAVAMEELFEEAGLLIDDPTRYIPLGSRQSVATFSAHQAAAWTIQLTTTELAQLKSSETAGTTFGLPGHTEQTRIRIRSVRDLPKAGVDWTTIGMAMAGLDAIQNSCAMSSEELRDWHMFGISPGQTSSNE